MKHLVSFRWRRANDVRETQATECARGKSFSFPGRQIDIFFPIRSLHPLDVQLG